MPKKKNKPVKKHGSRKDDTLREIKVRVVGIGGGGGSIIAGISPNLKKILFAVANTDAKALEDITKKKRIRGISFGRKITGGLGTGMDVTLGKRAAEEDIEEIKRLFKDQDIVIFVASLGGGTGSGALPSFAVAAREMGCMTYAILTLPFSFEGEKKMRIAKEAIREASPHLHALTILPNEKIFEIVDKNTPLKEALSVMNESLAESLEGLVETIYETGLVNIDFADIGAVLDSRKGMKKLAYLNTVEASLEEGTQEIVRKVVSNPLYPYGIDGARGALFNITGGKNIGLTDISSVSENIAHYVDERAKIIVGIMQKEKYGNKIKVSLLSTGCGTDFFEKEIGTSEEKSKKKEEKKEKVISKKKKKGKKTASIKKEESFTKKEEVFPSVPEKDHSSGDKNGEEEILQEEEKWEKPAFLKISRKDG